ncbi:MAG: hypothetical protein WCK73_13770, partial [Deltaproteobacteria bacterium]
MRKAFDANVPKLKPRLHPVGIATIDPEGLFAESGEPEAAQVEPAVQVEAAAQDPVVEPAPVERPAPEPTVEPEVARAAPAPAPVSRSFRAAARAAAVAAPAPAASNDLADRKERLEKIKRKVAEAARRGTPAAAPREPARAAESALSLVGDLDRQLARSRELEEALRADLHQSRTELARAAGDAEATRGRLGALEKEIEERRGMMAEMLAEMTALEEERDQSVRRAQALAALDEERQRLADDLSSSSPRPDAAAPRPVRRGPGRGG